MLAFIWLKKGNTEQGQNVVRTEMWHQKQNANKHFLLTYNNNRFLSISFLPVVLVITLISTWKASSTRLEPFGEV
jgi:hypothetical protein